MKNTGEIFRKLESIYARIWPELVRSFGPPATDEQIAHAESVIGTPFPQELREIYRIHNGEGYGLFFGLLFISLETMEREWTGWDNAAREKKGVFKTGEIDQDCRSIPPGCIREKYFHPKWVPISEDGGGNYIAVDLDPGPSGTCGQVINFGKGELTKYVIAHNLADFFTFICNELESGNYLFEEVQYTQHFHIKNPSVLHFLDALPKLKLPVGPYDE